MTRQVLLVEDHPDDEFLTLYALKKHDITDVVVTREGRDTLAYLFNDDIDHSRSDLPQSLPGLILLDLRLPKIDGFELLKKIRTEERTREIPVVVLSSSQQVKDIERCQELGVAAFITKPLDMQKLGVIRQLLK
jgi:CheY-like chemotaxis protein